MTPYTEQGIKGLLIRFVVIVSVVLGVVSKQYEFYLLLFSGVLLGTHYGLYNDIIWEPNGKLRPNLPYRVHQLWIHIICGIVGSLALYFLLDSLALKILSVKEFVLFLISILGYTGLLPRTLWFYSDLRGGSKLKG